MMKKAIAFNTTAGSTTATNNALNAAPPGKPTSNNAIDRKIVPETIVHIATSTVPAASFLVKRPKAITITKNTIPVTNLSIILGKKPPGNVENRPDRTPVVMANKNVSLNVGNNNIPINIIVSMKSGFIPSPYPGITK